VVDILEKNFEQTIETILTQGTVVPQGGWPSLHCAHGAIHHSSTFSLEGGLDGLPLRVSNESLPVSSIYLKGSGQVALHCAHRTSTFLSCAFCEQEGHLAAPLPTSKLARISLQRVAWLILNCACRTRLQIIHPSLLVLSSGMGADGSSTARVQRGPSQAARCASKEDPQAPSLPPRLAVSSVPLLE
jgi:hypothetical protein